MADFLGSALSDAKADLKAKRSKGMLHGSAVRTIKKDIKSRRKGEKQPMSEWLTSTTKDKTKYHFNEAQSAALRLNEHDLERSRKAMELKTKKYNQMYNRGMDMTLEGDQKDNLMVDFDRKWAEGHRQASSSEDEDEETIEIQDEFGRTRTIPKSQSLAHEAEEINESRPSKIIRGPHLQSFVPDASKKDEIWAEVNRQAEPVHYDPAFELRQRGTGYINLGSGDSRADKLGNLKRERDETLDERRKQGFDEDQDLRPNFSDREFESHLKAKDEQEKREAERNKKRSETGAAFLDSLI